MQPIITITGATGKVARPLTEQLLKQGIQVRAVARSAEHLAPLAAQGAEAYAGNLEDTPFLTAALRGAAAAFIMLPPPAPTIPDYLGDQTRLAARVAQALDRSGVERVVALSGQGAGLHSGAFAVFTALEEALSALHGLAVVALRSCYQMTNHLGAIPLIKRAGINAGAFRADLPMPMIASRDIAAIAAEYLAAPGFTGFQVRDLLGPRDYTQREATTILGAAIGRPDLPYIEWSYDEARENMLRAGFSAGRAEGLIELQRAINEGRGYTTPPRDAANTTPTTLEAFACDTFAPAYQAS